MSKSISNRKAALFTVDALIAVGAVFLVALGIVSLLASAGSTDDLSEERLHTSAMDVGEVLEQTGSLGALVSGSPAAVQDYIDGLEDGLCADVTLRDSDGVEVSTVIRNGCSAPLGTTSQIGVGRRVVPYGDVTYLVEVRTWYP